ncbi:SPASM domain-containing protein [Chryseosolibacter indicus]|uniref:SPASM domain-containing protein n=1 Tax=Chryseosolibacter indicus TaxID=2782351 RepID=A0ABS5VTR7_9BACT|nr:SPASM domain-containing protein [Chryseosolibacter indicus]MBT1704279.1 SPASM domain-containing protein [Chryseosolibacter indicus]
MVGSFSDTKNILSKTNWRRLRNITQIYSSYHFSRLINKPSITGLPISISIEPTTSCNLRCPECPSGLRSFTRPTGMLQQSLFESTIDQLADTLTYLTFYFQGEPYLHPSFLKMVNYASQRGIYTATSTNGHFLKDEAAKATVQSGLDRLIISIDGTTQETYQSYRVGGSLEKVLEGTRNIIKWKRMLRSLSPHIVFQFLVVKPNEHQINEVYRLAEELGVDQVVLKTAQIYNYENGSDLIPSIEKYSRYKRNNDSSYSIKNELHNNCWKMWHSCVITWDGKVVPCCFDKDGKHVLGDLQKQSFEEIWKGEPYNAFRKSLMKSRAEIEICKNCTEGTKVWA